MGETQKEFSIGQLVTLAIGTPEAGNVNFNLLQRVLTEMLKATSLEDVKIRVSSADANQIEESLHGVFNEDEQPPKSVGDHKCAMDPEKVDQLLEDMNQLKFDMDDLMNKVANIGAVAESKPFQEMRASLSQVDGLQEKLKQLETVLESVQGLDSTTGEKNIGQRIQDLERFTEDHDQQLGKISNLLDGKLQYIVDHFEDLEKEMSELNEKVNTAMGQGGLARKQTSTANMDARGSNVDPHHQTASTINSLLSRLSSVQHDLDNLTLVTNNLREEQEQKQIYLEALNEQIEVLKTVKADKENVEDIVAAKADLSMVHRKVSHDHFVTRVDELNAMIDDAFNRLDAHEDIWEEEVENLKTDIKLKLDKLEFDPLKTYVNEKLKVLQDKIKSIASQRKEQLAAGSKKRILRDVQCVSCDEDVIMKTDNTMEDMTPSPPLPVQYSIKPILTYQLDQVRKQQKKLTGGRNMHHFEKMLNECGNLKNQKGSPRSSQSGEHLANRYVGGSHTITTPQQRITHTGNFFQTWGPVITAISTPQPQPTT